MRAYQSIAASLIDGCTLGQDSIFGNSINSS